MNWQHLTYFLVIAKHENFSRAAEQLYITPSALSKAIHALEAELGFPLFERQGRNSVLTDYGKTFSKYVSQASDSIESGLRVIHEQMDVSTGRINISGIYTMCADYLPRQIAQFHKLYPKVTFSMEYQITSEVLDSVLKGASDLGFCGDYELDDESFAEIDRILLKKEELIVIVPKNHRMAQNYYVDFRELKDEDFIIYRNVNSGISFCFWDICKKANINPHIIFEVPDDHTIIGLVSAGLGIALIADSPSLKMGDISTLHFKEDAPYRNQYMVWNKNRFTPPVVKAFREYIINNK